MNTQNFSLSLALTSILATLLTPPRVEALRTIDAELTRLREDVARWQLGRNRLAFRQTLRAHSEAPTDETMDALEQSSEVMHRDPLVKQRWRMLENAAQETLWAYYLREVPPILAAMLQEARALIAGEAAQVASREEAWRPLLDPWKEESARYGCGFHCPPSVAAHLASVSEVLGAKVESRLDRPSWQVFKASITRGLMPPTVAEVLAIFGLTLSS